MELAHLLLPGDVLLYEGSGFFSWVIKRKTGSKYSHVECYIGNGQSAASRDGIGVGTYPLRTDDLTLVLRPREPFDLERALAWHATVIGQGYDWIGLTAFWYAKWRGMKNEEQFCSEHTTRFQREGTIVPFAPDVDADGVYPGMFEFSAAYWRAIEAIEGRLTVLQPPAGLVMEGV